MAGDGIRTCDACARNSVEHSILEIRDAQGSLKFSGNNYVLQTDSGTPISSGKIVQRRCALRSRCPEATVSRSAVKGKHAIEKEPAELEEQANGIAGVSSDVGEEPTPKRKRGRPAKVKSDLLGNEPTTKRKRGRPAKSKPAIPEDEPTTERERGGPAKAKPDLPVKAKPDPVPSDDVTHFSARVESRYYLELPVNLPSTEEGLGRVVYLGDPVGRIWPLLCDDDDVFPVSVLTRNWRIFCQRNRIKPGDECRFQAANNINRYWVDIVRGRGG